MTRELITNPLSVIPRKQYSCTDSFGSLDSWTPIDLVSAQYYPVPNIQGTATITSIAIGNRLTIT